MGSSTIDIRGEKTMQDGIKGGTLEAVCVLCAWGSRNEDVNKYVRIHHEVNIKWSVHKLCGISGSGPVTCHSKNSISSEQIHRGNPLIQNLSEFSLDYFDSILTCWVKANSFKEVTSGGIQYVGLYLNCPTTIKKLSCTDPSFLCSFVYKTDEGSFANTC